MTYRTRTSSVVLLLLGLTIYSTKTCTANRMLLYVHGNDAIIKLRQ